MAKVISASKIVLDEDVVKDLGRGRGPRTFGVICTDTQLQKLRVFVDFTSTICSQWWATCPNAVDTSYKDLQLYKALLQYRGQCGCGLKCTSTVQAPTVLCKFWLTEKMLNSHENVDIVAIIKFIKNVNNKIGLNM